MFDHVKFGVSDYVASKAFFLKALHSVRSLCVTSFLEGFAMRMLLVIAHTFIKRQVPDSGYRHARAAHH